MDSAVPCDLVINEAVTNALKHAFPDGRSGCIFIELVPTETGEQCRLTIEDDGVGLPEGFQLETATSLGLQINTSQVAQLHGTIAMSPEAGSNRTIPGTAINITFPS